MQRRVEQTHRDGQAVHRRRGSPRSRPAGPCAAARARRPPRPGCRRGSSAHDRQAVLAEEHVLGAAQADALGAELAGVGGVLAGVGVGAHASLPLRTASAQLEDRGELGRRLGGRRELDRAEDDLAGGAVERDDQSPSFTTTSPTVNCLPSILTASAPTTAGVPQPRATTAAWLTRPPRAVRMPWRHHHAVDVFRAGLAAHEDDVLAALVAASAASSAVKYTLPTAAPGDAARPLAMHLALLPGELRVQHLVEVLGATRMIASSAGST